MSTKYGIDFANFTAKSIPYFAMFFIDSPYQVRQYLKYYRDVTFF